MTVLTIGDKLMIIRHALGLSRRQVAEQISVPEHVITYTERNPDSEPYGKDRHKIMAFIQKNEYLIKDNSEDWITRGVQKLKEENESRIKAIRRTFKGGKHYFILDTDKGGNGNDDYINPMTGKGCIFVYLRKDGIHHIFRELHGGWTRTYTDVQLIGKTIKEVG